MTRKSVIKLNPCQHLCLQICLRPVLEQPDSSCPICRHEIHTTEQVERKRYVLSSPNDRRRIVECAERFEDWVNLAQTLGIKYKTAYNWVRSGNSNFIGKGGFKPKKLTEDQIEETLTWIENDCQLTLVAIKTKILRQFNINVNTTTIANYLEGRLFSLKKVHKEPSTMNSYENKQKRAEYDRNINEHITNGRQIVWLDETNFNLFCRKKQGRARRGKRAIMKVPASKGLNIHLIAAISTTNVVMIETRRGSFKADSCNEWMLAMFHQWVTSGNRLEDLVVVTDNAPCHARLQRVFDNSPAQLLRLGPYSPMLNPVETIWSKIKSNVKNAIRIPPVLGDGIAEQRMQYLERIVIEAKNTIMGGDCARAVQHTTTHYATILNMEDVQVGA